MASPTQWTWVWVNSGSWWWTGKPGLLQSTGLQRIRDNWVTKLNWNCGGGNEDNGDLLRKAHACTATLSSPIPAAGHHQPIPSPETPGHSRASLGQSLVGSLLLSPGSWHSEDSVTPKHLVPQSCVSFGGSMVGLMAVSSRRARGTLWSAMPRAAAPRQSTADPALHRRHSDEFCLGLCGSSQSLPGSCLHTVCLSPLSVCGVYAVWV